MTVVRLFGIACSSKLAPGHQLGHCRVLGDRLEHCVLAPSELAALYT